MRCPERLPWIAALALVSPACRVAPAQASLEHALRAEGIRSVALEERFVLYSPYEPARTQRYVTAANRALDDLEQGLDAAFGPPATVLLVPRPVEGFTMVFTGDELTLEGVPEPPSDRGVLGLAGSAGDRDLAVVYVPADVLSELPDGRTLIGSFGFDGDLATLRHELAHLAAARAGLEGPAWLDEGLAQLFEHGRFEDGVLVTDRGAASLVAARERFSETPLRLLLAWQESHADVAAEGAWAAGRPLSHALAVYMFEGSEGSVPERVRRLAALADADVLALEPGLRGWMTAGMPLP